MDCPSVLIKLLLSKAKSDFKTYVHVIILYRFLKLELCYVEVINIVVFICFDTNHVKCGIYAIT